MFKEFLRAVSTLQMFVTKRKYYNGNRQLKKKIALKLGTTPTRLIGINVKYILFL